MAIDTSMQVQGQMQAQMQAQTYRAGAGGDNEAAERLPDNEMLEMAANSAEQAQNQNQENQQSQMSLAATSQDSSGLAPWQGQQVDVTA